MEDRMSDNERLQGGPERRMSPERLSDLGHQLDAYPIKDEAQKQRLIKHLLDGEAEQSSADSENDNHESSAFDG
jgi:hypothetical protein